MNQNVFGVILFSLIVGTAIFVSEYFVTLPTPLPVYEKPITVKQDDYSCSKQSRKAITQLTAIKVDQAVLDQTTNNLHISFHIKRHISMTKDTLAKIPESETSKISLHFFDKSGSKTKYLGTEEMTITPHFGYGDQSNFAKYASFKWLDDLQKHDNLYVIAESSVKFNKSASLEPDFDEAKATSVLLMPVK